MPSVLQLPEPLMAGMSLEKRIPQLGASIGIRMRQSYLEVASISFVRRVIRLIQQNNLRRKYRNTLVAEHDGIGQWARDGLAAAERKQTVAHLVEQNFDEVGLRVGILAPNRMHGQLDKLALRPRRQLTVDGFLECPTLCNEMRAQSQLIAPPDRNVHVLVLARHAMHEQVDRPAAADAPGMREADHDLRRAQGFGERL